MSSSLLRFYELSYSTRGVVLLGALGAVALYDFIRYRRRATRWREYAFWLGCAGLGALFAVANDLVTSRISKAYFVIGKGLVDDPDRFRGAVAVFAAQVGSFAGIVVGAAFLLANNPHRERPQLRYGELARFLVVPPLGGLAIAAVLAPISAWDVQGLAPVLRQILGEDEVQAFLSVQRIHAGLYLGASVATFACTVRIRYRRRVIAPPEHSASERVPVSGA